MTTGPLFVFATGAGQPQVAPWMVAWARRLGAMGVVWPFDWRYLAEGRKRPDRHDVLLATHREALVAAREAHPGRPVVLAGKSMGGRIGCHLALSEPVAGVICFGYPLLSPTGARRDEVLRQLRTPALFVQGTRDDKAPLEDLTDVLAGSAARSTVHVVPTGDHSLQVTRGHTRTTGRTQDDEDAAVSAAISAFLSTLEQEAS